MGAIFTSSSFCWLCAQTRLRSPFLFVLDFLLRVGFQACTLTIAEVLNMLVTEVALRPGCLCFLKKIINPPPSPLNWLLCANVSDDVCCSRYYMVFISVNRVQLFIVSPLPWIVKYEIAFFVLWWLKRLFFPLLTCKYRLSPIHVKNSWGGKKKPNQTTQAPWHCSEIKQKLKL